MCPTGAPANAPITKRVSYRAKFIVVSGALVLAGVVGELVARGVAEPPLVRFVQMEERLSGGERGQFVELVEGDPETFWRLRPGVTLPQETRPFFGLISNSQSLRGEREFGPKADGAIRILFLGDSCTFGYGLSHEETVAYQAEQRLREQFPYAEIQCINAGVPGYTLFQGQQQLESIGYALEPDLIILSFGWNDGDSWDGRSDAAQYASLRAAMAPAPLAWSRLAAMVSRAVASGNSVPAPWPSEPRVSPEEFHKRTEEIQKEAKRRGIDLLLLVPGSIRTVQEYARHGGDAELTAYQTVAIKIGRQMSFGPYRDAGYVDGIAILHRLLEEHSIDDLFLDSVHPAAVANQAIAMAVAHRLSPWLRERVE